MSEIEDLREEVKKLKHGLEYYFRVADSERQRATSLRGECAHLEGLLRGRDEAIKILQDRVTALTEQLRTRAQS